MAAQPGERHLGPRDTPVRGHLADRVDDLVVAGGGGRGVEHVRVTAVGGGPAGGGGVPGAGEATAGERAPDHRADALVGAERQHLALLLAGQQVVVVLHRHEAGPAVLPLEVQRLGEFEGPRSGAGAEGDARARRIMELAIDGFRPIAP
jgi:hypothetical protein